MNAVTLNNSGAQPAGEKLPRLAFSINETGEILGLSRVSIYRLLRRGKLKAVSSLRHKIIPLAEIEAFLKREAA